MNSLNDYQSDQNKLRNIKLQIAHNREVLKLARERFDRGVGEFLKVLDADRSLLQAELQYTQSATKTAVDFVRLYKSLGGGWEERFPESEITKQ